MPTSQSLDIPTSQPLDMPASQPLDMPTSQPMHLQLRKESSGMLQGQNSMESAMEKFLLEMAAERRPEQC